MALGVSCQYVLRSELMYVSFSHVGWREILVRSSSLDGARIHCTEGGLEYSSEGERQEYMGWLLYALLTFASYVQ